MQLPAMSNLRWTHFSRSIDITIQSLNFKEKDDNLVFHKDQY